MSGQPTTLETKLAYFVYRVLADLGGRAPKEAEHLSDAFVKSGLERKTDIGQAWRWLRDALAPSPSAPSGAPGAEEVVQFPAGAGSIGLMQSGGPCVPVPQDSGKPEPVALVDAVFSMCRDAYTQGVEDGPERQEGPTRAEVQERLAALFAALPVSGDGTREAVITDAMVDAARDVLQREYGGRVLFSKFVIRPALEAAIALAPSGKGWQDDIDVLRQVAPYIVGSNIPFPDLRVWAHGLADRLAALSPAEPRKCTCTRDREVCGSMYGGHELSCPRCPLRDEADEPDDPVSAEPRTDEDLDPATRASVEQGLREMAEGKVVSLGSFAPVAAEPRTDVLAAQLRFILRVLEDLDVEPTVAAGLRERAAHAREILAVVSAEPRTGEPEWNDERISERFTQLWDEALLALPNVRVTETRVEQGVSQTHYDLLTACVAACDLFREARALPPSAPRAGTREAPVVEAFTLTGAKFTVKADPTVPRGEVHFRDAEGRTVGRIVNIGSDSATASSAGEARG